MYLLYGALVSVAAEASKQDCFLWSAGSQAALTQCVDPQKRAKAVPLTRSAVLLTCFASLGWAGVCEVP